MIITIALVVIGLALLPRALDVLEVLLLILKGVCSFTWRKIKKAFVAFFEPLPNDPAALGYIHSRERKFNRIFGLGMLIVIGYLLSQGESLSFRGHEFSPLWGVVVPIFIILTSRNMKSKRSE